MGAVELIPIKGYPNPFYFQLLFLGGMKNTESIEWSAGLKRSLTF
ncbi:MAG TPA: hypothetical protein VII44_09400 [Puia sp.]